jgi:hypothetical protein
MWHYGMSQRRCEDNLNTFSRHLHLVHSNWPPKAMWQTHAPTFNKWQRNNNNNNNNKVTLHILTHDAMWGCGLTSLVVCINDKLHDIREQNMTIRSEIWTMNICSLRFRDTRECVTLWRLILWSLGCTLCSENKQAQNNNPPELHLIPIGVF